jgi:hypothetical protein
MIRTGLLILVSSIAVAACGDSGSTAGSGGSGTGGGTTTTSSTGGSGGGAPSMCVQPADLGNENGVGHYCTPGGGECTAFPLAPLCLADVGQDEWFCTRIGCDETTDCGADAGCLLDPGGSACVPCACDGGGIGCSGGTGGAGAGGGAGGN